MWLITETPDNSPLACWASCYTLNHGTNLNCDLWSICGLRFNCGFKLNCLNKGQFCTCRTVYLSLSVFILFLKLSYHIVTLIKAHISDTWTGFNTLSSCGGVISFQRTFGARTCKLAILKSVPLCNQLKWSLFDDPSQDESTPAFDLKVYD